MQYILYFLIAMGATTVGSLLVGYENKKIISATLIGPPPIPKNEVLVLT